MCAESELRSQGSLSGGDGGGEQSYTNTDSSPTTSVLPSVLILPLLQSITCLSYDA